MTAVTGPGLFSSEYLATVMTYAHYMTATADKTRRAGSGLAPELRLAVMRLRRRLAAERDPGNDLSLTAMGVLAGLYRYGDLTVGDLAVRERVKAPTMTRTVNCLVDDGHVARRPHESDRRAVVISLTDRGRETLLADRARRDEWLATRLRALSAEERDVLRRATPILHRLAQED